MRSRLYLILFLVLPMATAFGQETHVDAGRDSTSQELTRRDTVRNDSSARKPNVFEKAVLDEAKKVRTTATQSKDQFTSYTTRQGNKIQNTFSKDTSKTDSTRRTDKVGDAVKSEAGQVKTSVKSQVSQAQSNTTGQVNKIAKSPSSLPSKKTSEKEIEDEGKKTAENSLSGNSVQTGEQLKDQAKKDAAGINRASVKKEIKENIPDSTDIKEIAGEHNKKVLEDKALKLQYNSDDPDGNTNPYSKEDLKDFKLPGKPGSNISEKDGSGKYKDIASKTEQPGLNNNAVEAAASDAKAKIKNNDASRLVDSLSLAKDDLTSGHIKDELLGAKRIYSDKYIQRLYDSLGVSGADSLVKKVSPLLKSEISEGDLLSKINDGMEGKGVGGASFDPEQQGLKMKDYDKLSALEKGDLSQYQLPDSLLSKLPPLSGKQLNSKYLPYIDSLKEVVLKKNNYELDEETVKEDLKKSTLKQKPEFLDKIYFEGIIGFLKDSTMNLLEFSPALAYPFTKHLSAGIGPEITIQVKEKKINLNGSVRTFVKAEVWKQRAYFQLEDIISRTSSGTEILQKRAVVHELLGGGGILVPISKSLAINLAVMYRLTKSDQYPNRSPWVIRVGLSSVKKK